jgi:hypothetical protein
MEITRTEEIYDLVLLGHGGFPGKALFREAGDRHALEELPCADFPPELRGCIGRVVRAENEEAYHFEPYPDQHWRREIAADDVQQHLWGWRLGDGAWHLLVRAGQLPTAAA